MYATIPSILQPLIQNATNFSSIDNGVSISRLWLDNKTTTYMPFVSQGNGGQPSVGGRTVKLEAGTYNFTAYFNYPQSDGLSTDEVVNNASKSTVLQSLEQAEPMSFLSYSDKLLAGAWRFLTYFGRDSMIIYFLMHDMLSEAVLERLNQTDGAVCHKETIRDYATYTNRQKNITSTAPGCTLPMVDTDYYLTPSMVKYFLDSPVGRFQKPLLGQAVNQRTISYISKEARLWEIGETALTVSAELEYHTMSTLHWYLSQADFFPDHPDWTKVAAERAKIWEDNTLQFFKVRVPYTTASGCGFPSNSSRITSNNIYLGLALDDDNNQSIIKVMNSDDPYRHFFVNSTNQTQLSNFLLSTANNILLPYPAGLSNPVGMLVANPAYSGDPVYSANFTNNAYHGTVIGAWPLAMMAKGLERQLGRCSSSTDKSDCCNNSVYDTVKAAYNHLWSFIDANRAVISNEV